MSGLGSGHRPRSVFRVEDQDAGPSLPPGRDIGLPETRKSRLGPSGSARPKTAPPPRHGAFARASSIRMRMKRAASSSLRVR